MTRLKALSIDTLDLFVLILNTPVKQFYYVFNMNDQNQIGLKTFTEYYPIFSGLDIKVALIMYVSQSQACSEDYTQFL